MAPGWFWRWQSAGEPGEVRSGAFRLGRRLKSNPGRKLRLVRASSVRPKPCLVFVLTERVRTAALLVACVQIQCARFERSEVKIAPGPTGCVHGEAAKDALDVSFDALKVTPKLFQGRRIRLKGFLELEFEETTLYVPSRDCDDLKAAPPEYSVWLDMAPPQGRIRDVCGHRHAVVEGVYDARDVGLGDSLGTLRNLTLIQTIGPACPKATSP